MIILGIETSCDETDAALIRDGTKILSNVVASSVEFHAKTGGIIPEPKLCTDNAAVIASAAYSNYKPISWSKISVQPGLSIIGKV